MHAMTWTCTACPLRFKTFLQLSVISFVTTTDKNHPTTIPSPLCVGHRPDHRNHLDSQMDTARNIWHKPSCGPYLISAGALVPTCKTLTFRCVRPPSPLTLLRFVRCAINPLTLGRASTFIASTPLRYLQVLPLKPACIPGHTAGDVEHPDHNSE